MQQITIEDGNQYRICGYENEIIKEIVKATQCQVRVEGLNTRMEHWWCYQLSQ